MAGISPALGVRANCIPVLQLEKYMDSYLYFPIMSSTWNSGIGKFPKKDPDHGKWGKIIKHWLCKIGICSLDKCKCDCHK